MIDRTHKLSVARQARLLGFSRGSVYYSPRQVSDGDLDLMRRIDELHLDYPFAIHLDSFPVLGIKTNGIGLGLVNLGDFSYAGLGKVRLFELDRRKPYLLVKTADRSLVLAFGETRNRELYGRLAKLIGK